MILRREDYEIAAFFLLVVVFSVWERLRPARDIDRWKEFKLDVLWSMLDAMWLAYIDRKPPYYCIEP